MVHLYRNGFKPRYFVWVDPGERDGLNDMFYNSMPVDEYNMLASHGQIRVEHDDRVKHDRVHEMINYAFGVQGGMKAEQYFDKAPNEEARRFYDQLEESSRPLCGVRDSPCRAKCVVILNLFAIPFGTANPQQYYPNYRRAVSAFSISQALTPLRYEDLRLQAIHRPRPLLAGWISDGTPSTTVAPSATPNATIPSLAPGQMNRLSRVMIEPDGSSLCVLGSRAQLTSALVESEQRRVAEQQSMSETVQQIKEQLMNLTCRPTTLAPEDTDNDIKEEEEDFVDATP
ncbi:hypothetical protein H5410_059602 [Solanum commersonii]|uniref:Uncharacterized protein n=1 Tax=Solanum commersonii TaxID=4109 RepID=A0A9J5W3H2_SOLCO|nr:hypothetical protein H5410_059602 [Solanum commersonii]